MSHTNANTLTLLTMAHNDRGSDAHAMLQEIYTRHGKFTPAEVLLEIREDGTNSIVNFFDGPVNYGEVVRRVADKLGVSGCGTDVEQNELIIIDKVIRKALEDMPEAEKRKLYEKMDEAFAKLPPEVIEGLLLQMSEKDREAFSAIQSAMKDEGGLGGMLRYNRGVFAGALLRSAYIAGLITLKQVILFVGVHVVRQLLFDILALILVEELALLGARTIAGLLIPGINFLMGAWMVFTLAGPAYRKIIPTVIGIAMIRMHYACPTFGR